MLRLEGLDGWYGPIRGLEPVSFAVPDGSCVAVCGINGAGKTTLFARLAGFTPPAGNGRIFWEEQDISALPAHRRARLGITLVPEGRQLFARLSVEQNLLLGGFVTSKDHTRKQLTALYQTYPQALQWRNRMAGHLSGGQQQLVALWRGVMANPKLLLVDEPLMGLSPVMQQEMLERLAQVNRAGITLFYTCQDLQRQLFPASHALVLVCGRPVYFGPANQARGMVI